MPGYYDDRLAAGRLRRCYEIAPPRIRQYLDAEVEFVCRHIEPGDRVLELGCGYGRVLPALCRQAKYVTGIDTSEASIGVARGLLARHPNLELAVMDATRMSFPDGSFDLVCCIQNGISAFHADNHRLLHEATRVTRPGGTVLFSSYAAGFWEERLAWFRLQAGAGLVGPLDEERTHAGVIVGRDGFTGTAFGPREFRDLTADLDADVETTEVDHSSLFCIIRPR